MKRFSRIIILCILNFLKKIFTVSCTNGGETRFKALDGFRGTLVLSVVLQHLRGVYHMEGDYEFFLGFGSNYGVIFFTKIIK